MIKYLDRHQPHTSAKGLLAEFRKLEKEAEKMLEKDAAKMLEQEADKTLEGLAG